MDSNFGDGGPIKIYYDFSAALRETVRGDTVVLCCNGEDVFVDDLGELEFGGGLAAFVEDHDRSDDLDEVVVVHTRLKMYREDSFERCGLKLTNVKIQFAAEGQKK